MERQKHPVVELDRDAVLQRARSMAETGDFYGIDHIYLTLHREGFVGGGIIAPGQPLRELTAEEAAIEGICVAIRPHFFLRELEDRLEDLRVPDRYQLDAEGSAWVEVFDEIEVAAFQDRPEQWNPLAVLEWRAVLEGIAAELGCELRFDTAASCVFRRSASPSRAPRTTHAQMVLRDEDRDLSRELACSGDYASHRDIWGALLKHMGFPGRWVAKVYASRGWKISDEQKTELRAICDRSRLGKQTADKSLRIITGSLGDGLAPPFGAKLAPPLSAGIEVLPAALWVSPRVWLAVSDGPLVPRDFAATEWPVPSRFQPVLTWRGPQTFTLEEALASDPWERPAP